MDDGSLRVVVALFCFLITAKINSDEPSAVTSCNDLGKFASHRSFLLGSQERHTTGALFGIKARIFRFIDKEWMIAARHIGSFPNLCILRNWHTIHTQIRNQRCSTSELRTVQKLKGCLRERNHEPQHLCTVYIVMCAEQARSLSATASVRLSSFPLSTKLNPCVATCKRDSAYRVPFSLQVDAR